MTGLRQQDAQKRRRAGSERRLPGALVCYPLSHLASWGIGDPWSKTQVTLVSPAKVFFGQSTARPPPDRWMRPAAVSGAADPGSDSNECLLFWATAVGGCLSPSIIVTIPDLQAMPLDDF